MAANAGISYTPLSAEKRAALLAAVERLPKEDREVLAFLLDVVYSLIDSVDQLTSAVRGLDLLDDLRAERIERLADQIAAYAPEGVSAVATGESLRVVAPSAEAAADMGTLGLTPTERDNYWRNMQRLQDRRKADAGELTELHELTDDGYALHAVYRPDNDDDQLPWYLVVRGPRDQRVKSGWYTGAIEAMGAADLAVTAHRDGGPAEVSD